MIKMKRIYRLRTEMGNHQISVLQSIHSHIYEIKVTLTKPKLLRDFHSSQTNTGLNKICFIITQMKSPIRYSPLHKVEQLSKISTDCLNCWIIRSKLATSFHNLQSLLIQGYRFIRRTCQIQ